MTPTELRTRAVREIDNLGPEPVDPNNRAMWRADWHGAVVLLAALAGEDMALLRRAALEPADEWSDRAVRSLLLAATNECAR
jgi:hypothetical protein